MLDSRSIRCLRIGLQALERYPLHFIPLLRFVVFAGAFRLVLSFVGVVSAQNLFLSIFPMSKVFSESNVTAILQDKQGFFVDWYK